jgi:hypothetical protein
LGGAAAAEGQDAANALRMDGSSCGFDRARSRPVKIFKGAKKAACYSKALRSPQSLPRRLASPFFLPATLSYYEVLTLALSRNRPKPTPLAPRPRLLALVRARLMPHRA